MLSRLPDHINCNRGLLNLWVNSTCARFNYISLKNNLNSRLRKEDVVIIRSDVSLQLEETTLITSERTLRESLVILDYLKFFDRLKLLDHLKAPNPLHSSASIFPKHDKELLELYVEPQFDFNLRLMSSLNNTCEIPTQGEQHVILARVGVDQVLYFRIFDNRARDSWTRMREAYRIG